MEKTPASSVHRTRGCLALYKSTALQSKMCETEAGDAETVIHIIGLIMPK